MATAPEIDGYSDLVQVGRGGFGAVYRANQIRFGRLVAVKVLNDVEFDDRTQKRFETECLAMGSLSWHPYVVAIHDSGTTVDGRPYLTMEFCDSGSLSDRLADGPVRWEEAVVAGVQVLGALGAAHDAGTLHRDLKPENLLIGPFGEAKLSDFGIAAVEGATRTTTGRNAFTVAHVAPEVLRGQRPDERSDLYSLGSTLHTIVAGAPPLAGDPHESIGTLITSVLERPPPRLGDVPVGLADVIEGSLSKDPAERPASAEEFGQALQRVQTENGHPPTELRLARVTRTAKPKFERGQTTSVLVEDPRPTIDTVPEPARGDPRATIHLHRGGMEPREADSRPTVDLSEPVADAGDARIVVDLNTSGSTQTEAWGQRHGAPATERSTTSDGDKGDGGTPPLGVGESTQADRDLLDQMLRLHRSSRERSANGLIEWTQADEDLVVQMQDLHRRSKERVAARLADGSVTESDKRQIALGSQLLQQVLQLRMEAESNRIQGIVNQMTAIVESGSALPSDELPPLRGSPSINRRRRQTGYLAEEVLQLAQLIGFLSLLFAGCIGFVYLVVYLLN